MITQTTSQNKINQNQILYINSKIKEKLPDMDLIMTTESESGRAHQRPGKTKLNEPRLSFLHDETCRSPSEDVRSRYRSNVENCENEHRSHQINYLEYRNHYAITKATKTVRNLIILIDTSNIRNDSSD